MQDAGLCRRPCPRPGGCLGQARTQRQIEAAKGRRRSPVMHVSIAGQIGIQPQQRQSHRVSTHRGRTRLADRLRDKATQSAGAHPSHPVTSGFPIKRLSETNEVIRRVMADADQLTPFGFLDRCRIGKSDKVFECKWLRHGHQVENLQHLFGCSADVGVHQFAQCGRHRGKTRPLPSVLIVADQPARLHLLLDQLAHEKHVAAGQLPQARGAAVLDRITQNRFQQQDALLARQRLQVQTLQLTVLPQRGDRLGHPFSGAERGDHRRLAAPHKLMQRKRRQVVDQMHVVNDDQYRGVVRGGRERRDHRADQGQRLIIKVAHPLRKRTQGNGLRGSGSLHRADDPAPLGCRGCGFPRQPGLTDPGTTGDHHATGRGFCIKHPGEETHLVTATDQWPIPHDGHRRAPVCNFAGQSRTSARPDELVIPRSGSHPALTSRNQVARYLSFPSPTGQQLGHTTKTSGRIAGPNTDKEGQPRNEEGNRPRSRRDRCRVGHSHVGASRSQYGRGGRCGIPGCRS